MDEEYHIDMLNIKKHMILKEVKEQEDQDSGIHDSIKGRSKFKDPVKLLINYDREVAHVTKKIREKYLIYLQFPKCYPKIEKEKKKFKMEQNLVKLEKGFDKIQLDAIWQTYWKQQIPKLCEEEVEKEKEEIRKKWEYLVPKDAKDITQKMETLVISDDEDDDDVVYVKTYNA